MADNEEETISHLNEWDSKTAGNEDEGEAIPRGSDWEVVSLTASAYAAAPGPRGNESIHEDYDSTISGNDEAETSRALFMSGHFVFPPSQHENLPVVEKLESTESAEENELVTEMNVLKESKYEEKVDEKEQDLYGLEFNEPIALHGLNVGGKEHDLYGAAKLSSFPNTTLIGGSAVYDGSDAVNDLVEASQGVIDPSYLLSQAPKTLNKDEDDDSGLPCGAWWKRQVAALCAQAKETSAFWSIFVAAAVMGLVVLGQRWQLSVGNEKSGRVLSSVKDVIVGGNRRGSYVNGASCER